MRVAGREEAPNPPVDDIASVFLETWFPFSYCIYIHHTTRTSISHLGIPGFDIFRSVFD